ncbi:hypothetical protein DDP54_02220 [Cellulomonas sp. WB94]|uniref:DUF5808 domain-containing protein n=1 Tax=Cellulomonas sp. WB94 TaxID=2173174 RepID=UPI000D563324|nr:DUF5808 domain-containing protein [Cellulomonas sp. WB94]PVU82020.1 hypothetical protein DDP54_02220 [Cellulomonas sp. WB94]
MGSHHEHDARQHRRPNLVRLATIGLAGAAVVKELRTPQEDREWHGTIAGFVPYDFRAPTVARFKERLWAPDDEHLFTPQPFGVGWTVNVGRVVALVRNAPDRPA